MSILCSFKREFSEIPPLQRAYTLYYEAQCGDSGKICFALRCTGGYEEKEELSLQGLKEECAVALTRFLFENGVGPASWKEILLEAMDSYMNG